MMYEIEYNLIKNFINLFIFINILLFHSLCIITFIHTTHRLEKKQYNNSGNYKETILLAIFWHV